MKEKLYYDAPSIEIITVELEQGYATSPEETEATVENESSTTELSW